MTKLTLLLIFLSFIQAMAIDSYAQMTRLSLQIDAQPLEKVLEKIEDESEFFFLYNKDLIDVEQKVSVNVQNETIKAILDEVLDGKNIAYTVYDRQIVLSDVDVINKMVTQQKSVSGKVTDSNGQPLPGVTVIIRGTTQGTVTNADGEYSFNNIQKGTVLQFSFVGMRTQDVTVDENTTINVVLEEESIGIEEVVAVGYGTMKKSDLVGAVDQVKSDVLANRPTANLARSLQGEVAGLNISFIDSKPSRSTSINIRGTTSIGAGGSSLVLIDGVEGDIKSINPQDVESVSVLKDASSAAIYGARGAFGVILITTKNPRKGTPTVNYNGSVSFNRRTVIPESVTDGLDWLNWWIDSYNGYYNGSKAILDHIDSTVPYTEGIHQELIRRRNDPSLTKIIDLEGHSQFGWAYLESTDWYDLFYKDYH